MLILAFIFESDSTKNFGNLDSRRQGYKFDRVELHTRVSETDTTGCHLFYKTRVKTCEISPCFVIDNVDCYR